MSLKNVTPSWTSTFSMPGLYAWAAQKARLTSRRSGSGIETSPSEPGRRVVRFPVSRHLFQAARGRRTSGKLRGLRLPLPHDRGGGVSHEDGAWYAPYRIATRSWKGCSQEALSAGILAGDKRDRSRPKAVPLAVDSGGAAKVVGFVQRS